jgi:outer membrane protein, heavy metal efflux system
MFLFLVSGFASFAQSSNDGAIRGADSPAGGKTPPFTHLEKTRERPSTSLPQSEAKEAPPSTGNGPVLRLTLADAVAMARKNNPRLHEAAAMTSRAEAGAVTARAYTNPSVEVYEGNQSSRPVTNPGTPGLLQHYAAAQTIEIPMERHARASEADQRVASSRSATQSVSIAVIADAQHAFYSALRQREEIQHAQENLQLVQDLRRRVEVEVKTGEKGRLELTRAEAEMARARFAVRSAEIQYVNAIVNLRVTIAAPADARLEPQGEFEPRTVLPPMEDLRKAVIEAHPLIAESRADRRAAQADLDRQRALRIPQPVAFAEFENQPDLRFWRVGFTIPIPLWDRRRGQIADARAAVSQSEAVLNQRQLELTAELERAYEQYQLADQQATSLEAGSLHAAESAVDAAKAAYRFGERGIVEVLDAQRVLQNVRGDLLDAQFARQSALVDLERLGAVQPAGGR